VVVSRRRNPGRFPKASAYHEAGHAVARLHVGAIATTVEIHPRGGGYTHGTPNRWPGRGQHRMWTWLLVLFAGSYAQAFVSGRSLERVLITSGRLDLKEAKPAIDWLVTRGYAGSSLDVLGRTHLATCAFLALRWEAIERVAVALLRSHRLTARQVRALART
jgi:hypothetical protein